MGAVIIIPARLESSRLSEKLLRPAGGRPVLWWTWQAATECKAADTVLVATDSPKIVQLVKDWGGRALLTSAAHPSGSSRVAEVAHKLGPDTHVVVNLQGDEPTIQAADLGRLIDFLVQNREYPVATLACPLDPERASEPSVVKVVGAGVNALYFSRQPLPGAMHHVGVYGYRKASLLALNGMGRTPLAAAEDLEQLLCLERGWKFGLVKVDRPTIAIDTGNDYERFKQWVHERQCRKHAGSTSGPKRSKYGSGRPRAIEPPRVPTPGRRGKPPTEGDS